jgi:hypothetical protein
MHLTPVPDSSKITIETGIPDVGPLLLWVPEAISSNTGNSAVYPLGHWTVDGATATQHVAGSDTIGPGNAPIVDDVWFECAGIRFPVDSPVEWSTHVKALADRTEFRVTLRNVGTEAIAKAGAAICLSFLGAAWWSDSHTYVESDGTLRSLAELGRDAGRPNGFQAYLLAGESYDHEFFNQFWGVNEHEVDRALIVSEHRQAGVRVGIEASDAYFVHSNAGNPCTDMMLAFGDMEPGATAEASGAVWVRPGAASL